MTTIMHARILNCMIWFFIKAKRTSAMLRTTKLATYVKPFLKDMSLSLLWVLKVIELTKAILEICTQAQPILKIAGSAM